MNDLDRLPLEELQEIDWERLTEAQAQGFGLHLGLFNDAMEEQEKVKAVLLARLSSLLCVVTVGVILLLWANPASAIAGIVCCLAFQLLLNAVSFRAAQRDTKKAQEALTDVVTEYQRG